MANNPRLAEVSKATQFKPGVSGNPAGKPAGTKHITTHIQEMLMNPDFEANLIDAKKGYVQYKGPAIKALMTVLSTKAVNGDLKALELLLKYGYSQKIEQENTGDMSITVITRNAGTPANAN